MATEIAANRAWLKRFYLTHVAAQIREHSARRQRAALAKSHDYFHEAQMSDRRTIAEIDDPDLNPTETAFEREIREQHAESKKNRRVRAARE